jgi:hypothetical protein
MFSGGQLNADVMYDLSVLDDSGTEVIKRENLIAKNSQHTQPVLFPANYVVRY